MEQHGYITSRLLSVSKPLFCHNSAHYFAETSLSSSAITAQQEVSVKEHGGTDHNRTVNSKHLEIQSSRKYAFPLNNK